MELRLKIAGFGGQGVMITGKILGYAASDHGKYATFLPQYGAQQRGGTANCTVVISDQEVGSPVVGVADSLMIFDQLSMDAYADQLKPGGLLFYNSDTCRPPEREDVEQIPLPIDELAKDMGKKQVANIIMLGAFTAKTGLFTPQEIVQTLRHVLEGKQDMLNLNEAAIYKGVSLV